MTSRTSKWVLSLSLSLSLASALVSGAPSMGAPKEQAWDFEPEFVGASAAPRMSRETEHAYTYMLASEMKSTVASLTGYLHPAFDAFADVLGRFDTRTGTRTNDRPSLVSVFFMHKISADVASRVVEREIFVDDAERIVFQGVDLAASPTDDELANVIDGLHTSWLGTGAGAVTLDRMQAGFRQAEQGTAPSKGYQWLLAMFLRHGGLYYY